MDGRIFLCDGTKIDITDDKVTGELKIETQMMNGSAPENTIDIGAVPAARLTMTSVDDSGVHSFAGARLWLSVCLRLENGEYESVIMGKFYIDSSTIKRIKKRVSFVAYDKMLMLHYALTDEMRTGLKGMKAQQAAEYLTAKIKCGLAHGLDDFPNSDIPLDLDSEQIVTARDAVMWIAQMMGCFARIDRMGRLDFVRIGSRRSADTSMIDVVRSIKANQRFIATFADSTIQKYPA